MLLKEKYGKTEKIKTFMKALETQKKLNRCLSLHNQK